MALTAADILMYLPQQKPFRFVDEVIAIDSQGITGNYTFREDEFFYTGHFPGKPITPGVILLECMAQLGVVAFGIYLLSLELEEEQIKQWLTFFTDAEVEFYKSVYPGDKVIIKGEKCFWRRMKLKANITLHNLQGELLAECTASGVGVKST